MPKFDIHTLDTAPRTAHDDLRQVQETYGFIPNLLGELAESPATLSAYLSLQNHLNQSNFDKAEQLVLQLAISHENGCDYCQSAHATVAKQNDLEVEVVEALTNGDPLPHPRYNALAQFARDMVENRGELPQDRVNEFLTEGFTKAQVLEVILAVSMKTLSNYANHILETPVDTTFQQAA
jgi:uncharacterized peroxidase-related enzyme